MTKTALALLLAASLTVPNAFPQSKDTPPARPGEAATGSREAATDPGVRKLSRREKKDRIAKLPDSHREFLKDVEPIILPREIDTFLMLESDAQRDLYIEEFWKRRDSDTLTARNEYRDNYAELLIEAKEKFKYMTSERTRVYLTRGRPAEIADIDCRLLVPMQIWSYGHLPALGRNARILFYKPRLGSEYKLYAPMGRTDVQQLAELISNDSMVSRDEASSVHSIFYGRPSRIEMECNQSEKILEAIFKAQRDRFELMKIFEPPPVDEEDVGEILRATVIFDPAAPKMDATVSPRYPGKRGGRTATELAIEVDTSQLKAKEIEGAKFYNLDVTGEVLKDGKMFETYRYRYDFPAENAPPKLAMLVERFLRPANYQSRIKVTDINGAAEAIVETPLAVPNIGDAPETAGEREANAALQSIQKEVRDDTSSLRIAPFADRLHTGLNQIETLLTGSRIRAVEFYLDGRKVMTKRNPPYTLDLDFGEVPQPRRIRAIGLDENNKPITGDEIVVNVGTDPFRVRIVSPRVALDLKGKVRVQIDARAPEGKELAAVEVFLNDAKVATLYDPPFVQTVDVPANLGIGYLRAVATLKDSKEFVEDVVLLNTPEFLEEVNVHLVELPTTVTVNGKPTNALDRAAFEVYDEKKKVELAKFDKVTDLPLSLGFAIDASGSMRDRMSEAQKAGGEFFQNVLKEGDKAFVVSFDKVPSLVQKWTRRLSDLNASLASVRAEESTALYDAVVFSLYNFHNIRGQKALVVLSDGKDTASKFSYDQTIEYAKRSGVPIYVIGLGIRTSEVDVRFKLSKLATETGGEVYHIEKASGLGEIYKDIREQLRSQYILGFYPPSDVKPGSKWREVEVRVDGGKAKTIRGYYP